MGRLTRLAMAVLLLLVGQPAAATWLEAQSDHFVVYSQGGEASLREFTTRLERFDQGMRRIRGLSKQESDRSNPLIVYVVDDVAAVRRLCMGRASDRKMCANVAGFYDGRASGSVIYTPRRSGSQNPLDLTAQVVLFHEYSHHFMFANYSAAYPAWYVEGFAEFNSTASFERDGSIGFGKPAVHRLYGLMMGPRLPLATLLTANVQGLSPAQRDSLYGRGWLLTHYLTFEPARKDQLGAYLEAINAGKPSLEAARSAFGDLGKLDTELNRYLDRRSLSYVRLNSDETPVGAVKIRPLTSGEAAMMPIRLRSDRGVDETSAAAVVVEARRLAARFATDAGAQLVLAEAEYDAGNDDLAEAAANRALAASPEDRGAMLYKGRAQIRRAERAGVTDVVVWREARSWFVKANRLAPDDAEPLMLFYRSFLRQRIPPTANSVVGLEQAFTLAPQDPKLRFLLAQQYLRDGKTKQARTILIPLAFNPHAPPDNPAATLVALIDKGDVAAIVAQIDSKRLDENDP